MSTGELFRIALDSIRAHKLRSFLTLVGIIIGVTTVVAVASVISGMNAFVRDKIIRLAPDVFVVTKFGAIHSHDEFLEAVKRPDLTPRDLDRLRATLTRAAAIGADVTTQSSVKHADERLADIRVHGCTANFAELAGKDLELGRWFSATDETGASAVAVIGWDIRDELFPERDPIGRSVAVGGVPFRIVGVVTQQGSVLNVTEDNHVYVPITAFRKNWGASRSLDLVIQARGGVSGLEPAQDEVRGVLRAVRHTGFHAPDPFALLTAEDLQDLWRTVSGAAFAVTLLIASVSLGVGGIVIMNIMLVGVAERTREIGVRLAMGARKRDIRRQFLLEAALLSMAGGLAGVGIGGSVPVLVRLFLHFPAQLTPAIAATGLGLATAVGLAAGYWPARSASNLAVIDALRDET